MDAFAANSWGWFALALVNAGLAEQKNRSRLSWFFVSLFLGPIATLAIVAWAPPEKNATPPPPIQLSTGVLAIGLLLMIGSALLGALAWGTEAWGIWIAAGALAVIALGCFVWFIARRPTDAAEARERAVASRE